MESDKPVAVMPHAVITDDMTNSMTARIGTNLRIDHSVNNEWASRLAIARFAGGIGDDNPLWLDATCGADSDFRGSVAPPSFVLGCFSGIQFGWPGLGAFHSQSHLWFDAPVYQDDQVKASCVYEGFDGPAPSKFAGRAVTDRFVNCYANQFGQQIATVRWQVINFERGSAQRRRGRAQQFDHSDLPHPWTEAEVQAIEDEVLAEKPRGAKPRYWEDVSVGDLLEPVTKGPIGLTDEIAFVAGGGTPIPRLKAHAAALREYAAHPAWAFRDPTTMAKEPIYSVHYNSQAANAMSVPCQYDVGFQRQCWQLHHLTHWAGDNAWVKECSAQYRNFVYLSDVIRLRGEVTGKRRDETGETVVDVRTEAMNQRGQNVMPGWAVVALPNRDEPSPASRRARAKH